MSFEAYLQKWLGNYQRINETGESPDVKQPDNELLNMINSGIGGETTNTVARTTSFESIEQVLEKIDVSLLEKIKSNPELQKVVLAMVSPGKVEWLSEYLTKSKKTLNSIAAEKKKVDTDSNFDKFTRLTLREADIKSRIYKLYTIFKYSADVPDMDTETSTLVALRQMGAPLISSAEEGAPKYLIGPIGGVDNIAKSNEFSVKLEGTEETKTLPKSDLSNLLELNPEIAEKARSLSSDSNKKKVAKLVQRAEDTMKKEILSSLNNTAKIISELPNTEKGMEKLQLDWKPLIDALGYSKFYSNTIKEKEKQITRTERPSLRRKNRIKENLMAALRSALLPRMVNGEISEPGGDYFKLFKKLEEKNPAWLEASIRDVLSDSTRIAQFNNSERRAENGLEENQLAYLQISSSWIEKYIQSEVEGELSKRDMDNALSAVKRITQEKEKEIKNYYLSKDFNMKNFNGIQIKPGVKLPLYQKVKIIVTEKDRIIESPLKNILKGVGQIVNALFSNIPDRGDLILAQKNAERNKALFNGVLRVITVGAYGMERKPKQEGEKESTEKTANEQVEPGVALQTPASLPAENMDTMALAGPGKKKKSEKKKSIVQRVSSFSDFLKDKK